MPMMSNCGFKLWTTFLSVTFALLFFPTIVARHGVGMSLVYTSLGVGFIWLLYVCVGGFISRAVAEEMKSRDQNKAAYPGSATRTAGT
jgi:hypothetical protein